MSQPVRVRAPNGDRTRARSTTCANATSQSPSRNAARPSGRSAALAAAEPMPTTTMPAIRPDTANSPKMRSIPVDRSRHAVLDAEPRLPPEHAAGLGGAQELIPDLVGGLALDHRAQVLAVHHAQDDAGQLD